MSMFKSTLMSLFLLSLAACSTNKMPDTVLKTEVKILQPPMQLFRDPPPPNLKHVVISNDILDNSDAFALAYEQAVEQIRIIREWYVKSLNADK